MFGKCKLGRMGFIPRHSVRAQMKTLGGFWYADFKFHRKGAENRKNDNNKLILETIFKYILKASAIPPTPLSPQWTNTVQVNQH